jgi:3,4-dihydroxy 2-butanone 4-phosphate synthase / GTP cyclohydrolase II
VPPEAERTQEIERALERLAAGRMLVVVDDEERAGGGDLVLAAQFATPEALNFMNRRAGGWVCLALTAERCDQLHLRPQPGEQTAYMNAAYMNTIDARVGLSDGVSAHDLAHSTQVAIDPSKGPGDLISPGRVQPLRAEAGGVLALSGRAEAAVDLARLAGLNPAAVISEIQDPQGAAATGGDLAAFCREHDLPVIEIGDLIAHRHRVDRLVERVVDVDLPTRNGSFRAVAFRSLPEDDLHVAYVKGDVSGAQDVLIRVHTGCLTGDVFHSRLCGCGELLETALQRIEEAGRGVLVYLDPQPRGRGVLAELAGDAAHHLARIEPAAGERPATLRSLGIGAQILKDLGLSSIRVMTSSPKRMVGLEGFGLTVTEQIALEPDAPRDQAR